MRGHKNRARPILSFYLYHDWIMAKFLMSGETKLDKIARFHLFQQDLSPKWTGCLLLPR